MKAFVICIVFMCCGNVSFAEECVVNPLGAASAQVSRAYVGGCSNGKANGSGSYEFVMPNAVSKELMTFYVSGNFVAGKLDGIGGYENKSTGAKFEGEFKQNRQQGSGKLVSRNGDEVGEWRDGIRWNITKTIVEGSEKVGATRIEGGKQTWHCMIDRLRSKEGSCPSSVRAELLRTGGVVDDGDARSKASNVGAQANRRNSDEQREDPWQKLLEATGNKQIRPPAPAEKVEVRGKSPLSVDQVVRVCTDATKAGMMMNIPGAIFLLEFMSPVDGATIWGNMGPKVKDVTPVKLHAVYPRGEKAYTKAVLFQDAFGEWKCQRADG